MRNKSLNLKRRILRDLVSWKPGAELDLYPYFRDFFHYVFQYPKKKIKINERMQGGVPDISLFTKERKKDVSPWVICEVKPEPGYFRIEKNREHIWQKQLRRYVTADVVYALLLDPTTIIVLTTDGRLVRDPVFLDLASVDDLLDFGNDKYVGFLTYENSISTVALQGFVRGVFPSKYIDVTTSRGRNLFHAALRISATELRNYAVKRIQVQIEEYEKYSKQMAILSKQSGISSSDRTVQKQDLLDQYGDSRRLVEDVFPIFQTQIGREIPKDEKKAQKFTIAVYAAEAANLVLARILFVRFFEDYKMVTKKISNGGICAFRDFYTNIKDDYRFLLDNAFKDSEGVYSRLFERSVFDWAHDGNHELSKILLRIFYRLNAFDFSKITGDTLGNLYEQFLDPQSRKKLGEFYTPDWVVDYILKSIGYEDEPGELLDPACGSGTFLFRAIESAIKTFRNRGVPYKESIKLAVELIHGIDINIFAAFIAQLQVIWHLFPHLKKAGLNEIPDLKIYGGIDSLEGSVQKRLDRASISTRETRAIKIRDRRFKYVVGNPPYIRAERVKTSNRWETYYAEVAKGKKDVAYYFLYRALKGGAEGIQPWLETGGKMGFIVSYSIADSKAAKSLREVILKHKLDELVDLESLSNEVFTSGIASSRGTVAPIIIITERSSSPKTYPVKVAVGTRECLKNGKVDLLFCSSSTIPSSIFEDDTLNPWHRFLTKIHKSDLPLLRKLIGSHQKLSDYAECTSDKSRKALGVGIQTGRGKGKIFKESSEGRFPMARGLHIHTFYLNKEGISEYVKLSRAQNKSLWRYSSLLKRQAYAINEIGYAPQAAIFDPSKIVAQKSCIVFIPRNDVKEFPWDVYLNSSTIRYLFGLLLRSALIEGNEMIWRSTINVKDLGFLPVPKQILQEESELAQLTLQLRDLAEALHKYWDELDTQIKASRKVPLASLPVKYHNVDDPRIFFNCQLKIEEKQKLTVLQPYRDSQRLLPRLEADKDLLIVLKYLIENSRFQFVPTARARVPRDYKHFSHAIRQGDVGQNPQSDKFRKLLARSDRIIGKAFGLSNEEYKQIHTRLSTPPFVAMQPRWPWEQVSIRATKVYTQDRFST